MEPKQKRYGEGYINSFPDNFKKEPNQYNINQFYALINDTSKDTNHTIMCYFKKTYEEQMKYDIFLRLADEDPLIVVVNCPTPTKVRVLDDHCDFIMYRGNPTTRRFYGLIDDTGIVKFTKCESKVCTSYQITTLANFIVYWSTNTGAKCCPVCGTSPPEDMPPYSEVPCWGNDLMNLDPGMKLY